jgi:hypothetical protein
MERAGVEQRIVKLKPRPRFSRVAPGVAKAKIRGETLRVMIALGLFADADGQCWPSTSLLAAKSGVGVTHIPRALRDAVEKGVLHIGYRPDGSNLYTLIGLTPIVSEFTKGGNIVEPPVVSEFTTCGNIVEPPVVNEFTTGGKALCIDEHPNEHPSGTAQLTARARGGETAAEILTPIEVERSDQFELLWLEYPSRPDDPKQSARKAFDELISKGVNPEQLISAAVRYGDWVKRDAPGGAYVAHLHRWLREGRYQNEHKAWAQPRQGIFGAAEAVLREPLLDSDRWQQRDDRKPFVSWIDRLDELERTATWCADWGPPPNDPACQLPPRFRGKPCVRRWLDHAANNIRATATDG